LLDDSGNYYYQFFLWSYLTTTFITHKVNRFQNVEDDFKTKQFFRIWQFRFLLFFNIYQKASAAKFDPIVIAIFRTCIKQDDDALMQK
jgi:hypothetical protein